MKNIERLLLVALAAILTVSCGPYSKLSKEQQSVVDSKVQSAYVRAIKKPDVKLDITQIVPVGLPTKFTNGEFRMTLEGNEVTARLPFIGTSHEPHMGGIDDISIVFDHEKVDLTSDFSKAGEGEYKYKFKGGDGYYKWEITLRLYDNGTAYIDCTCQDGRMIKYIADITLRD